MDRDLEWLSTGASVFWRVTCLAALLGTVGVLIVAHKDPPIARNVLLIGWALSAATWLGLAAFVVGAARVLGRLVDAHEDTTARLQARVVDLETENAELKLVAQVALDQRDAR